MCVGVCMCVCVCLFVCVLEGERVNKFVYLCVRVCELKRKKERWREKIPSSFSSNNAKVCIYEGKRGKDHLPL